MNSKEQEKRFVNSKDFNQEYTDSLNQHADFYNDLIGKVCHEINNPLTLISSTIQLMEDKYPEIKDIKYWSQLSADVDDCIALLSSFNTYKNFINISINNDNLLDLITSIVDSFIPLAEKNNVELSLSIDESSKKHYLNYPFDKIRLKQAFTNLIKNAIEAVAPGGYVCVNCSYSDDSLIISIHDNGESISSELREEIFTPFISKKVKGFGFGLPIAKSIITSHMGDINISSNDKETSFIVKLPVH